MSRLRYYSCYFLSMAIAWWYYYFVLIVSPLDSNLSVVPREYWVFCTVGTKISLLRNTYVLFISLFACFSAISSLNSASSFSMAGLIYRDFFKGPHANAIWYPFERMRPSTIFGSTPWCVYIDKMRARQLDFKIFGFKAITFILWKMTIEISRKPTYLCRTFRLTFW